MNRPCSKCGGTGKVHKYAQMKRLRELITCKVCKGHGWFTEVQFDPMFAFGLLEDDGTILERPQPQPQSVTETLPRGGQPVDADAQEVDVVIRSGTWEDCCHDEEVD